MTPIEFNVRFNGWRRRKRAELENEAQWAVFLVNNFPRFGKRGHKYRVEELIGMSEEKVEQVRRERERIQRERAKQVVLTDSRGNVQ